jgi:hypothetical protein
MNNVLTLKPRTMKNEIKQDAFVTVDEAFELALYKILNLPKTKIYVWRQRYKDGKLSHKKVASILEAAGFKKVVEERWMPLTINSKKENRILIEEEEPFKD